MNSTAPSRKTGRRGKVGSPRKTQFEFQCANRQSEHARRNCRKFVLKNNSLAARWAAYKIKLVRAAAAAAARSGQARSLFRPEPCASRFCPYHRVLHARESTKLQVVDQGPRSQTSSGFESIQFSFCRDPRICRVTGRPDLMHAGPARPARTPWAGRRFGKYHRDRIPRWRRRRGKKNGVGSRVSRLSKV